MKQVPLFLAISVLTLLCACKKNYACFGSETLQYSISTDSTSLDNSFKIERDFDVFQTCIKCSNKDKQALLIMILEQLLRLEEKEKQSLKQQGYYVHSETILRDELFCEEK